MHCADSFNRRFTLFVTRLLHGPNMKQFKEVAGCSAMHHWATIYIYKVENLHCSAFRHFTYCDTPWVESCLLIKTLCFLILNWLYLMKDIMYLYETFFLNNQKLQALGSNFFNIYYLCFSHLVTGLSSVWSIMYTVLVQYAFIAWYLGTGI